MGFFQVLFWVVEIVVWVKGLLNIGNFVGEVKKSFLWLEEEICLTVVGYWIKIFIFVEISILEIRN